MAAIYRYPRRMVIDHTRELADMHRLLSEPADTEAILHRALDALREVVPCDLAAVLRLEQEHLVVAAATGPLANSKVRAHQVALAQFPTIQRAMRTRRAVPLEAHHHASDEGDPYDGVLDLPHGHSCMVIPLSAEDANLGVITLDRSVCGVYDDGQVQLAELYGQLVSVALLLIDQMALLQRDRARLQERNRLLLQRVQGTTPASQLLESSSDAAMQDMLRVAKQAASSELPILILGETGTGKEVMSQAIHGWSSRSAQPLVTLNCSAIPEGLVESELFGHKKGAFSGADRDRQGRFVTANGGTLLLDEIGDLPLSAQAKLLRVLQEGTFEPVGSDEVCKVDVRVLAATHVDLDKAVAEGRFRQDLWYRLAVFPLQLPPLRDRPEDAVVIARRFLATQAGARGPWHLSEGAQAAIRGAPWPGNVRELRNVLERATVLQPSGEISAEHLLLSPKRPSPAALPPGEAPASFEANERAYLTTLLRVSGGKLYGDDGAALRSGLKPSTLRSKLVKHGLR